MRGAIIYPIEKKVNEINLSVSVELALSFDFTLILVNTKEGYLKPSIDFKKFLEHKIENIKTFRSLSKTLRKNNPELKLDYLINPYLSMQHALNEETEYDKLIFILDETEIEDRARLLQRLNRKLKVEILYLPTNISYRLEDLDFERIYNKHTLSISSFLSSMKKKKIVNPCFIRA